MTPKYWLYGLLGIFIILGLVYGCTMPLFESSDEFSHLQVIYYFSKERTLPPPVVPERRADSGEAMAWFLAFHNPPLYYAPPLYHALGAVLTSWSPMEDLPARLIPNPGWEKGWTPQSDTDPWNKNIYVHLPDETFSQSATFRAAMFLRLISLLLGCVPVICAYKMTRLLWPEKPALAAGAAGFVSLNPQFIATAASVTNDLLLCALFSLALWVMVKSVMEQDAPWWQWACLGGIVGWGALVKQSALMLLPLGGLAILWQIPGNILREWRKWLVKGAVFGLAALGVCGWWYGLNAVRYGDSLGMAPHLHSQVALTGFDLQAAISSFRSYWAAFGWGIPAPEWFYWMVGCVVVVSMFGVLKPRLPFGDAGGLSLPVKRSLYLLGGAFFLNCVAFVRWAVSTGAPFGRLLFPSIAATGVLWAWGLGQVFREQSLRHVFLALGSGALCFAVWVPWGLLHPAYASPYRENLPGNVNSQDMAFANGLHFLGHTHSGKDLYPGDQFDVALYWQAGQVPTELYTVWSQLGPLDPTQYVAGDDRWLGGTLYPSNLWQAGDIVAHVLQLQVPEWTPAPALYWLRLGLVGEDRRQRLPLSAGGDFITLGPWRIRSAITPAAPMYKTDFRLGEAIYLLGYDVAIAETVSVTLTWQSKGVPIMDYTAFVHLVGEDGSLIAQQDSFPAAGNYPTSWWLPGDVVKDLHRLSPEVIPQTPIYLNVGLYDGGNGQRLPVYNGDGERLSGDVIKLPVVK